VFFEKAIESVGASTSSEIKALIESSKVVENDQRDHLRNLSSHGFTRPYGDDSFENIRSIYYELTDFGRDFIIAMEVRIPETTAFGIRDESAEPPDFVGEIDSALRSDEIDW